MATMLLINGVDSSADSTTNVVHGIDLSEVTSLITTGTTAVFTWGNDGGAANTITFTVTGGDPSSDTDEYLISDDAAGQKMKNVARIVDWFMGMVHASKNSKTHKIIGLKGGKGLTQKMITAQAGLTFTGATTEPLVTVGVA